MAKCLAANSGVMGQMLAEAAAQALAQGPEPYCLHSSVKWVTPALPQGASELTEQVPGAEDRPWAANTLQPAAVSLSSPIFAFSLKFHSSLHFRFGLPSGDSHLSQAPSHPSLEAGPISFKHTVLRTECPYPRL